MVVFKDCTYPQGADALLGILLRLTVLRGLAETEPAKLLLQFLFSLDDGDISGAIGVYHRLTANLLARMDRRVSGDIWRDFILCELLEKPNAFSSLAASGGMDESVYTAMRKELTNLGTLASLDSLTLKRWAEERYRELKLKPRQAKDNISLMSSAAWGGSTPRPLPNAKEPQQPATIRTMGAEGEWITWNYAEPVLSNQYVSDEALEEIYLRLMSKSDWGSMTDDIWNFHCAYGTGEFIRSRIFRLQSGRLVPIEESGINADLEELYELQRSRLLQNTISFMRSEPAYNTLIYGEADTGKTAEMLSLVRELPEVRLIITNSAKGIEIFDLLKTLSAQPLKFIVVLDDIKFDSVEFSNLKSGLCSNLALPQNVLLYATSRTSGSALFPLQLKFGYLPLKDFLALVMRLLSREHIYPDTETVRNACIDYQVEAREALCLGAAYRVTAGLKPQL